jgi:hypothetical protein
VSNIIVYPLFGCVALKFLFVCRPILVLPPADIQVIYCELTESEKDFYEALFKRSKVFFIRGTAYKWSLLIDVPLKWDLGRAGLTMVLFFSIFAWLAALKSRTCVLGLAHFCFIAYMLC